MNNDIISIHFSNLSLFFLFIIQNFRYINHFINNRIKKHFRMMLVADRSLLSKLIATMSDIRKSCSDSTSPFRLPMSSVLFIYESEGGLKLAYVTPTGDIKYLSKEVVDQVTNPEMCDIVLNQFNCIILDTNAVVRNKCFV